MDSGGKSRQIIIGHANTWHDPAIAIGEGDELFAEGLERHTQCKRALDMPRLWYSWRTLRRYFEENGRWPVRDAHVTALSSWTGTTPPGILEKPGRNPIAAALAGTVLLEPLYYNQLLWVLRGHPPRVFSPPDGERVGVAPPVGVTFESKNIVHQLSHAANAVYTSPFEDCVVLVVDGYGEGSAVSLLHYADGKFEILHQEKPVVSLGLLYASVTQLCGFDPYQGEEWKVMGLAAFGAYREDLYGFFRQRLEVDGISVSFRPPEGRNAAFDAAAWEELEKIAGAFRLPGDPDILKAADLAHNFQKAFEDTIVDLADGASKLGLSKNLAFAGGCALNSSANGKIVARTGFERVHMPSAPGDDGNALGVVLLEKHLGRGEPKGTEILSPYLGSTIDEGQMEKILGFGGIDHREIRDEEEMCSEVADLLADGKIVAWVQGRAEWGPRALGNRSILADPRRADMKEAINARIKFREFYRPFAPAILDEHGEAYFEDYQQAPYMERTLAFRDEVKDDVPAVVHEDGTGRLQSVRQEWNPLFHRLLTAFHERTDVPVLLNTSFNVMGKPIVHSAQDAITVFFTTGLDHLVVGPWLLSK